MYRKVLAVPRPTILDPASPHMPTRARQLSHRSAHQKHQALTFRHSHRPFLRPVRDHRCPAPRSSPDCHPPVDSRPTVSKCPVASVALQEDIHLQVAEEVVLELRYQLRGDTHHQVASPRHTVIHRNGQLQAFQQRAVQVEAILVQVADIRHPPRPADIHLPRRSLLSLHRVKLVLVPAVLA